MSAIHIVIGPPCAGKSSYVNSERDPQDVRIDFDEIARALGSTKQHGADGSIRKVTFSARTAGINRIIRGIDTDGWIIHTRPQDDMVQMYVDADAEFILVDPGEEACLKRAASRPPGTDDAVRAWYANPPAAVELVTRTIKSGFPPARRGKKHEDCRMKLEHKTFPLEVKEITKSGEFTGYLSVFGEVDAYRDIVLPGAFRETLAEWKKKGKLPPLLWQHRSTDPIGPFTAMEEDEKGLAVEGLLLIDEVQRAREAHALLKANVVSGLSMGFETIVDQYDKETDVRSLIQVKLWEGSIATFPANASAQVEAVKAIMQDGELPDIRIFERFLREAGFSKSQAKAVSSHGLPYLLRCEAEGADAEAVSDALARFQSITLGVKS